MSGLLENGAWDGGPFLFVSVADGALPQPSYRPHENTTALALDMGPRHHRGFWAMQLDEAAGKAREPHIIVAQGLACLAVVRWAQLSPRRYFANVAGAYLISPLSFTPSQAAVAQTLLPSPVMPLPFASRVVERRTDPLIARVLDLVDTWGSQFVEADGFTGWSGAKLPAHLADAMGAESIGL